MNLLIPTIPENWNPDNFNNWIDKINANDYPNRIEALERENARLISLIEVEYEDIR